jgi:hypothetical protein
MRAARAQGKAFSASVICLVAPSMLAIATQPPSLMKGRLILLTDNLCFGACLSVTDDFRKLGAFHVGQTTDAATRFVDVRENNTRPRAIQCFQLCNQSTRIVPGR